LDCEPTAHTALFVLAILAIVPLAAVLSHATEAISEKMGEGPLGLYRRDVNG